MRNFNRVLAFVALALAVFAVGCTTKPVYNVPSAPIASSKPNPNMDDIGKAIQRAGAALGWNMQVTKPGHILGTLNLRTHEAIVDVNYSPTSYSINYKDSKNLQYDGTNIHNNYNGWIQNLDKGIRAQLSLL